MANGGTECSAFSCCGDDGDEGIDGDEGVESGRDRGGGESGCGGAGS